MEGEEDYLVRSSRNCFMSRSVSTEVDLEPGKYSVLMKIEAIRVTTRMAPEDVIREFCRTKREKLLQIGLSYDLAHAKAQTVETEAEKKRRRQARKAKKLAEFRKENAAIVEQRAKQKRKAAESAARKTARKAQRQVEEAAAATAAAAASASEPGAEKAPEAANASSNGHAKNAENVAKHPTKVSKPAYGKSVPPPAKKPDRFRWSQKSNNDAPAATEEAGDELSRNEHSSAAEGTPDTKDQNDDWQYASQDEENQNEADSNKDINDDDDEAKDRDGKGQNDDDDEDDDHSVITPSVATTESQAFGPLPEAKHEDEFARSPWNAVCVVSLRVYSKGKGVSIEVIRPREVELETALDPDDVAADAAKDGREPNEVEKAETEERDHKHKHEKKSPEDDEDKTSMPDISALTCE